MYNTEAISNQERLANLVMNKALIGTQTTKNDKNLILIRELASRCEPEFVAKLAVYAYEVGKVRDSAALLTAILTPHTDLFYKVASRTLNNMGQIRKFVYFKRNGLASDSKSLGTAPRRYISRYLSSLTATQLFSESQGGTPSTADIIRLTHTKPEPHLDTMIKYLMGYKIPIDELPEEVRDFKAYMAGELKTLPDVPVSMLTSTVGSMNEGQLRDYIAKLSPNQLRRELNLLGRKGAWNTSENVSLAVTKLSKFNRVKKQTIFPFSLWVTINSLESSVPKAIKDALVQQLSQTLDQAAESLNESFTEPTTIALDCSGSMASAYDNSRSWQGGLNAQSIYTMGCLFMYPFRKNPNVNMGLVNSDYRPLNRARFADMDLLTFMSTLEREIGGGTALSAVVKRTHTKNTIIISDNETWADSRSFSSIWTDYEKERKLVLWDITPRISTPVSTSKSTLNFGGIAEGVYQTIEFFLQGVSLMDQINSIDLG